MERWLPCSQDIIARELKRRDRGGREKVEKETHSEHKIKAEKSKCFSQIIKTGNLTRYEVRHWVNYISLIPLLKRHGLETASQVLTKRPQHGALNSPQCAKSNKISSKNRKNGKVESFDQLLLLLATLLKLTAPPLHHSTTIPHTHMYKHAHVHAHARPETILRALSGWLALPGNVCHHSSVKFKACSRPADKLRPDDLPHLGRTAIQSLDNGGAA